MASKAMCIGVPASHRILLLNVVASNPVYARNRQSLMTGSVSIKSSIVGQEVTIFHTQGISSFLTGKAMEHLII